MANSDTVKPFFLNMYGQEPTKIADMFAEFVGRARDSVDMAVYDFRLSGEARDIVIDALNRCEQRGVVVRFVYNADFNDYKAEPGNPERSTETLDAIQRLGYPARPVPSRFALMHHKYVVLDAGTAQTQVWTGSANFTDHSWSLQDNNILIITEPKLAQRYADNFEDLWITREMEGTDRHNAGRATLIYEGKQAPSEVHFSPDQGRWLDHEIAVRVEHAKEQVTICTGVLTSGHIISAITEAITHDVSIDGVYDRSQMLGVRRQWEDVPGNHWKIAAFFEQIVEYGNLVGKITTPWSPSSQHDFMHNKILVVDDTVITGSYNFSRSAEENAENVLFIESAALAADYRAYVRRLADMYRGGDVRRSR